MLDHLAIQCADVDSASAFYDAVLATLGGGRVGNNVEAVCHAGED